MREGGNVENITHNTIIVHSRSLVVVVVSSSEHLKSSAHSPTFPLLHLHHNSFSNPSVALSASQLILQPYHCFTYIADHSPILLLLLLSHRLFTLVTWQAAHETNCSLTSLNYSRYHHYHKWMAIYCNCIVRDILNIATFSHRYGALPCDWKF